MSSEYHSTEPCSFVCLSVFPHYHVGSLRMGMSILFPSGVYNDCWYIVVPWYLFNELISKLAIISNSGALDLHSPSGCEQMYSHRRMRQQNLAASSIRISAGASQAPGKGLLWGRRGACFTSPPWGFPLFPYPCSPALCPSLCVFWRMRASSQVSNGR